MVTMVFKETFFRKGNNAADLDATKYLVIQYKDVANRSDNLPHNSLVLTNLNPDVTLFVFLDDFQDQDSPDFTLFPLQNMSIKHDEGYSWENIFVKNTHATIKISAKELKHRVATVREMI